MFHGTLPIKPQDHAILIARGGTCTQESGHTFRPGAEIGTQLQPRCRVLPIDLSAGDELELRGSLPLSKKERPPLQWEPILIVEVPCAGASEQVAARADKALSA